MEADFKDNNFNLPEMGEPLPEESLKIEGENSDPNVSNFGDSDNRSNPSILDNRFYYSSFSRSSKSMAGDWARKTISREGTLDKSSVKDLENKFEDTSEATENADKLIPPLEGENSFLVNSKALLERTQFMRNLSKTNSDYIGRVLPLLDQYEKAGNNSLLRLSILTQIREMIRRWPGGLFLSSIQQILVEGVKAEELRITK